MRLRIINDKKKQKYKKDIYKLSQLALKNDEYDLFATCVDLMADVCVLEGLEYAKHMSDQKALQLKIAIFKENADE